MSLSFNGKAGLLIVKNGLAVHLMIIWLMHGRQNTTTLTMFLVLGLSKVNGTKAYYILTDTSNIFSTFPPFLTFNNEELK